MRAIPYATLAAAAAALLGAQAHAGPVTLTTVNKDSTGHLSSITNLNVGGSLFDVRFVVGPCASAFSSAICAGTAPGGFAPIDTRAEADAVFNAVLGAALPTYDFNNNANTQGALSRLFVGGTVYLPYQLSQNALIADTFSSNGSNGSAFGALMPSNFQTIALQINSLSNINYAVVTAAGPNAVPEPATAALSLAALAAAVGASRQRRKPRA